MKGESRRSSGGGGAPSREAAEALALEVLNVLVADPERLGRFLGETGLDPATIRAAASGPGFLAAVLDHVAAEDGRLLEVAGDLGTAPERIMAARHVLSPDAERSP